MSLTVSMLDGASMMAVETDVEESADPVRKRPLSTLTVSELPLKKPVYKKARTSSVDSSPGSPHSIADMSTSDEWSCASVQSTWSSSTSCPSPLSLPTSFPTSLPMALASSDCQSAVSNAPGKFQPQDMEGFMLSTTDEESTTSAHSDEDSPMSVKSIPASSPLVKPCSPWQVMLARTKGAVVYLKTAVARSFQEEKPITTNSTGFVVDAKNGIILTNRHCVNQGPSRVVAVFEKSEELPCEPIYKDPIHDFAFIKYNPAGLRRTKVAEIPLCPQQLAVGSEVCVLGNDAGEKHQVMPCIVARLDRDVPDCDFPDENTFYAAAASNTAEGSSGSPVLTVEGKCVALNAAVASSGGGGFFLPLERVCYCFELLKQGNHVPRGTVGASFVFRCFEEAQRLGVPSSYEDEAALHARPGISAGYLVVHKRLRDSKAARHLRSGDVLLELGGKPCFDFVCLEAYLDARVGQNAEFRVCRGGKMLNVNMRVDELQDLMPKSLLEFGFGVFHDVGYQLSAQYNLSIKNAGVYVACPGLVFEESIGDHKCVMTHVNGNPTPTLREFEAAIVQIADNESFSFSYLDLSNASRRRTRQGGTARMISTWTGIQGFEATGLARNWSSRVVKLEPSMLVPSSRDLSPSPERQPSCKNEEASKDPVQKVLAKLRGSMALVQFRRAGPFVTEFLPDASKKEDKDDTDDKDEKKQCGVRKGVATILDAASGLCVTDRLTVPEVLGDIELTLGENRDSPVRAHVVFLHPHLNLAFLRYNPADLHQRVCSAKIATEEDEQEDEEGGDDEDDEEEEDENENEDEDEGEDEDDEEEEEQDAAEDNQDGDTKDTDAAEDNEDSTAAMDEEEGEKKAKRTSLCLEGTYYFVGLNADNQFVTAEPTISKMAMQHFPPVEPTSWRPHNAELISLSDAAEGLGGVLCDKNGTVLALYSSFPGKEDGVEQYGISVDYFGKLLQQLLSTPLPLACSVPSLDVEFSSKPLGMLKLDPRHRSLSAEWRKRLQSASVAGKKDTSKAQASEMLYVSGVMPGGAAEGSVQIGDVLLAVNGSPVVSPLAVEQALWQEAKSVVLTLHRCGKVVEATIPLAQVPSDGAARVVMWAGCVLREAPRAICEAFGLPEELEYPGVFCSKVLEGSPGKEARLEEECFLRSVGGEPIHSLDDFLAAVKASSHKNPQFGEDFIRVDSVDLEGWDAVTHVRESPLFWPTLELQQKSEGGIVRIQH